MAKNQIREYKILDLTEDREDLYCHCLEDWSDEMKEAGDRKKLWYEKMKDQGLGVKLAADDDGVVCGMIQYIPGELAPLEGDNFYYIYCTWVHGHKEGPGNRQGRGMGSALLRAAEEDARQRGALGLAAWGLSLPFWMKASWYKKHGYRVVQNDGIRKLLWKPFTPDAVAPRWLKPRPIKEVELPRGKVLLTSVVNGICPAMNICNERAKAVAAEWKDQVEFQEIDTSDPSVMAEWTMSDALFLNHKELSLGPPITRDKLNKMIEKAVKRIR